MSSRRYSILSLFLIVAVPASLMTLALVNIHGERTLQKALARNSLAERAGVVAALHDRVLLSSQNALIALAANPLIASGNTDACGDALRNYLGTTTGFEGIIVVDAAGRLLCSSSPAQGPLNYGDRPYFKEVLATKAFTLGRYVVGRTTGQPQLPIAYPVLDGGGEVTYVVVAAHSLRWLDELLVEANLPPSTAIYVVDHDGAIVSRKGGNASAVRAPGPDPIVLTGMLPAGGMHAFETERDLFGVAQLSQLVGGVFAVVQAPKTDIYGPIDAFHDRSVTLSMLFTVMSAVVLWLLSELVVRRPMRRLMDAIARIETGDLDARVGPILRFGEMANVAHAFDAMADRLRDRERQLRQAQKMEAVGNLTGGLAHDFNNLLTIVTGNLALVMESRGPDDPDAELLDDAQAAAWRGAELTRQLLAFARRQPLEAKRVDPNGHLAELCRLMERTLGGDLRIATSFAADVWPVRVDPSQLETAVLNLATNARDAMPGGGTLTIETANQVVTTDYADMNPGIVPGDYVTISVTDTGTGILPGDLDRIFEPFFTTKDAATGTGLGLAMVFGFARQTGGQVKAYSEVGEGTTMRLYLPRDIKQGDEATAPAASVTALGKGEPVLVVDDTEAVRRVVLRQLVELGYQALEARDAVQALELLDRRSDIALMVTDMLMPDIDGLSLARMAQSKRPDLAVLYVSGFPSLTFSGDRALPEGSVMISKPFRREDLGARIRQALASREST